MNPAEPAILICLGRDGKTERRDVRLEEDRGAPRQVLDNETGRRYLLASEVRCWGHWADLRGVIVEREVRVCRYFEEVNAP